jgi:hypothetical protein
VACPGAAARGEPSGGGDESGAVGTALAAALEARVQGTRGRVREARAAMGRAEAVLDALTPVAVTASALATPSPSLLTAPRGRSYWARGVAGTADSRGALRRPACWVCAAGLGRGPVGPAWRRTRSSGQRLGTGLAFVVMQARPTPHCELPAPVRGDDVIDVGPPKRPGHIRLSRVGASRPDGCLAAARWPGRAPISAPVSFRDAKPVCAQDLIPPGPAEAHCQ